MKHSKSLFVSIFLLSITLLISGCNNKSDQQYKTQENKISYSVEQDTSSSSTAVLSNADNPNSTSGSNLNSTVSATAAAVPDGYWFPEDGDWSPYVERNGNRPYFTETDYTTETFETYSELDSLGRCGVAYANICKELMPTEERGEIGQVKPSGWHTVKYDVVNGKYLYNRCHLIGFQLAGENANEKNLVTGTRYLNIDGMLDHENEIADYVKKTGNHVLYRVTPEYTGDNLVCDGLLMEAYSVEDGGTGVCFCIYARNIQPGIAINYATGDSMLIGGEIAAEDPASQSQYSAGDVTYIVNRSTHKFHTEECTYAVNMSEENREEYNGDVQWLLDNGYEACSKCLPELK